MAILKITEKNAFHFCQYMERKQKSNTNCLEWGLSFDVFREFEELLCDTVTMVKWCETHLDERKKKSIMAALRKVASRKGNSTKTIEVADTTSYLIGELAKHSNMTKREYVETHIKRAHDEMRAQEHGEKMKRYKEEFDKERSAF